jgi:hypothetical protein
MPIVLIFQCPHFIYPALVAFGAAESSLKK